MIREVYYGNKQIEYELTYKSVRNINLRIKFDGKVYVSSNKYVPVKDIDNFVASKGEFIFSAIENYKSMNKNTPKEKHFVTGETFKLLGKDVTLNVLKGNTEQARLEGNNIYLTVKDVNNYSKNKVLLEKLFNNIGENIFSEIVDKTADLFIHFNISKPTVKFRKMKSRWGSCMPQKGIITLNKHLVQTPVACIEYVVLHEFCHFIHPNHSKAFYEVVERLMPDYKERKKELDKYTAIL